MKIDLGAKEKFRPLDNKEFSVLERLCKDKLMMNQKLGVECASNVVEGLGLMLAELKPKIWFRYVNDTFIIWPHSRNKLSSFLAHLNNQDPDIKFIMESEQNWSLLFLDVLISRLPKGCLLFFVNVLTQAYLSSCFMLTPHRNIQYSIP